MMRRDVFIEFTANNKDALIENIRGYSEPFEVTVNGMVNGSKTLPHETKAVFNAFNFDKKTPGYGEFLIVQAYCNNGFLMRFKEVEFEFYVYQAEGKELVVLSKKSVDNTNFGTKFWYYENGSFTPIDFQIRKPDYDGNDCRYDFRHEGIEYYYHYGGDENGYETFDYVEYHWNGEWIV